MILGLAYCHSDRHLAQDLLKWMGDLGRYPNHVLVLFREKGAQPIEKVTNLFGKIEEKTFIDPWRRWVISSTNAFQSVARYVEHYHKQPFLFIEPDCVPIKEGWLDKIETEYRQTKKDFMGAFVPKFMDSPAHMSGIGVYPADITLKAGIALMVNEQAPWDIAAAEMIRPQAHFTDLIQHRWDRPPKPPVNTIDEIYSVITKECVLFHGDKSGSWIRVLRENKASDATEAQGPSLDRSLLVNTGSTPALADPPPEELPVSSVATESVNGDKPDTREDLVRDTVKILKQLCTAPRYVNQVRKELRQQGVIK